MTSYYTLQTTTYIPVYVSSSRQTTIGNNTVITINTQPQLKEDNVAGLKDILKAAEKTPETEVQTPPREEFHCEIWLRNLDDPEDGIFIDEFRVGIIDSAEHIGEKVRTILLQQRIEQQTSKQLRLSND